MARRVRVATRPGIARGFGVSIRFGSRAADLNSRHSCRFEQLQNLLKDVGRSGAEIDAMPLG